MYLEGIGGQEAGGWTGAGVTGAGGAEAGEIAAEAEEIGDQPRLFSQMSVLRTVLLAKHSSSLPLKCTLIHVDICAALQVYTSMHVRV